MKYNKFSAFTLAEVMILLLTLSILIAAFSPIFTRRYNNVTSDEVWSFVAGDSNYDAYNDAINKRFTAQSFIGLTPANKGAVTVMSQNDDSQTLYSKLVIGASNKLKVSLANYRQNQMQFRYGDSAAGDLVGNLFAGNNNILLGGLYYNITNDALRNTAYGHGAMSHLKNGLDNTALGHKALENLEGGARNTAVGYHAGVNIKGQSDNTFIGHKAGAEATSYSSTMIGNNSGLKDSGSNNTAIGNETLTKVSGDRNVAVGNYALQNLGSGSDNTAVGFNALANLTSGSNNTAIGDNTGLVSTSASNKTYIGSYSGSQIPETTTRSFQSGLFTDDVERVFIGTYPKEAVSDSNYPGAVVEVHRPTGRNGSSQPIPNVGNESVVINGNLIVRGQTYLETIIQREGSINASGGNRINMPKALVMYGSRAALKNDSNKTLYGFMAFDGTDRTRNSIANCRGEKRHAFNDVRPNCICTGVAGSGQGTNTSFQFSSSAGVSRSYDWFTKANGSNCIDRYDNGNCCEESGCADRAASYVDKSFNTGVALEHRDEGYSHGQKGNDQPLAHLITGDMGGMTGNESCCPVLTSDIRLKNVGNAFTGGLNEIRKINIYNFTFKNDVNKLPHVGVIAQDLKMIFPNAVSKDNKGYYRIRWDEMLYAAINSIKTLNSKVEKLASRIVSDKNRVAVLKKDNAELNAKLDKLADELTVLEAKKRK